MQYGDVIGELIELTDTATVRHPDGTVQRVPREQIHRLKAVPPGRADAVALEEIAAAGWPALRSRWLGRWLLRESGGWTKRANSALILGDPDRPVATALAEVADWYAAAGLTGWLAVPLPWLAGADREAERAGWVAECDVAVLTAALPPRSAPPPRVGAAPQSARRATLPTVTIDAEPTPAWLARYRDGRIPPEGVAVLTAARPVGFASLHLDGEVVAVGRGVVTGRWLGVAAVQVHPDHRRRGLARQVMAALTAWGVGLGAHHCYLQVEEGNAAAMQLYRGLGFTQHHRYRLRRGPR